MARSTQILTKCGGTGVRRQPRHPVPRDFSKERKQCRASIPDDGAPDQGADGHHGDEQHQAERTDRARSGCLEFQQQLLLNRSVVAGLLHASSWEGLRRSSHWVDWLALDVEASEGVREFREPGMEASHGHFDSVCMYVLRALIIGNGLSFRNLASLCHV
jgi:hypothetical protein